MESEFEELDEEDLESTNSDYENNLEDNVELSSDQNNNEIKLKHQKIKKAKKEIDNVKIFRIKIKLKLLFNFDQI